MIFSTHHRKRVLIDQESDSDSDTRLRVRVIDSDSESNTQTPIRLRLEDSETARDCFPSAHTPWSVDLLAAEYF